MGRVRLVGLGDDGVWTVKTCERGLWYDGIGDNRGGIDRGSYCWDRRRRDVRCRGQHW